MMRTILCMLCVLGGLAFAARGDTDKVSRPFEYQGYSVQQYADLTVGSTTAPMSDGILKSGIPMYHIVGWFDGFARGGLELYSTMAGTNPSKVVVAPSYHDFETGPFWAELGHDPDTLIPMLLTEHLRYNDPHAPGNVVPTITVHRGGTRPSRIEIPVIPKAQ